MNEYQIFAEGFVRDFDEVKAVDSVDISVSKGGIYRLLGPNGAGKSTTVLTTPLIPNEGHAFL